MNTQSGKSILIFFVAVGWLSLMSYIYLQEKRVSANTNISGYDIGVLAYDETVDRSEERTAPEDFIIDYQPHEFIVTEDNQEAASDEPDQVSDETTKQQENNIEIEGAAINENIQSTDGDYHEEVILDEQEETKEEFSVMTSQDFLDIYDAFEVSEDLPFLNKYIYNIPAVDIYITGKAMVRGYKKRGFGDEADMISFENIQTRPEVRDAYVALRNEMLEEGIRLHFVSGYRSSTSQRTIFKNKLNLVRPEGILDGSYDAFLDSVLAVSAIPGYSKHHSGYAADFGCGNDYLVYSFAETECYKYLAENNFKNARRHGFIPSYPEGVTNQGPNPEPWEFVWVGENNTE